MLKRIFKSIIKRFVKTSEEKSIDKNKVLFANMLMEAKSVIEVNNGGNK